MAVIGGFKVEWYDKEVMNAVKKTLGVVTKEVAEDVMNDAKRILKQKAKTTTEIGLLSQFDIQSSKFEDGGLVVWCQGPGNWHEPYHASFVELGSHVYPWGIYPKGTKYSAKDKSRGTHIGPKPFMRPARKKNLSNAKKKWQEALDKL